MASGRKRTGGGRDPRALADAWAADRLAAAEAALDRRQRMSEAAHACQQPIQALRLFLHVLRRRLPDPADSDIANKLDLTVDGIQSQIAAVIAASAEQPAAATLPFRASLLIDRLAPRLAPLGRVRAIPSGVTLASDPAALFRVVADAAQAWAGTGTARLVLGCRRGRRAARLMLAGRPLPPPRQLAAAPPPDVDLVWAPERGLLVLTVPVDSR